MPITGDDTHRGSDARMLGTAERAKVEENAVGSNKATGQERVWCMAKRNHRTIGAKRPPNCCNSSAARRVSENTA